MRLWAVRYKFRNNTNVEAGVMIVDAENEVEARRVKVLDAQGKVHSVPIPEIISVRELPTFGCNLILEEDGEFDVELYDETTEDILNHEFPALKQEMTVVEQNFGEITSVGDVRKYDEQMRLATERGVITEQGRDAA